MSSPPDSNISRQSSVVPANDMKRQQLLRTTKRIAQQFPMVPVLTATQLRQMRESAATGASVVVVDCRTGDERAVSIIPGSISAEEFEAGQQDNTTAVCYCTIGYRSSKLAGRLRQRGVDARNLEGGILSWTQKGFLLCTPEGEPTKHVHVFGQEWALQPEDYEPVVFKRPTLAVARSMLPGWLGGIK